MSQDPENLKKLVKERSEKLAKLGMELARNQFSYKVDEKPSKEYWGERIEYFKKYNEKGLEYYNEIFALMNLVNKEEAQKFLLLVSKFHQIGQKLIEIMEKIKTNPSVINSKDKQQSVWSKEIRQQITEQSNECLHQERDMNTLFREYYDKELKKILE